MDRAEIVHENFLHNVKTGSFPKRQTERNVLDCKISKPEIIELFRSQLASRHLDRISRRMQASRVGYYTIGSSGHEGNAAIAAALRPTDPAFLHYRDAAFQIQRSTQVPGETPIWDMLLSFTTSSEDPLSGGRHKVLGSKSLNIPPQTSTIASHLPKAIGAAYSIALNRKLRSEHQSYPDDAVVLCSFGDASINHSTAQGALNTAAWTAYQNTPLPLIFVCEDNGIGISTSTPIDWVESMMRQRTDLRYFKANGLDILDVATVSKQVSDWVRVKRKPAFLHLKTVRLYGHAGADVQQAYMSKERIENDEANDPLLHTARILMENDILGRDEILNLYETVWAQVENVSQKAIQRPRISSSKEVMASLIPPPRTYALSNGPDDIKRNKVFGESDQRAMQQAQPMAKLINLCLTDLMLAHQDIVLAGEDIGTKGGVYGVTQRLFERFGASRVINTLLDEQSILGLAIGLAHNGILPIPEIQFLAYLHNAEDQLRGEAATLSFFSNGQFTNPMVIRIAGLGYQRGFGGHFHNDNSIAVLRDIPGVIVACPANGLDAALMLRECVRLAREEQRVVVFLEPIALYMTRDLHNPDDGEWAHKYPQPTDGQSIEFGQIGEFGDGTDLAIVTFGNGYFLSRKAEKQLREKHGISCKIMDLRWLAPLPENTLLKALAPYQNILIVDETRMTGSVSETLFALFHEKLQGKRHIAREIAKDSFIATGPAYGATLPSTRSIVAASKSLLKSAGAYDA